MSTFGGYQDQTNVISAAAQAETQANLDLLLALIPDIEEDPPLPEAKPDFDQIPPHTADKLRAEITALKAAVAAAPAA